MAAATPTTARARETQAGAVEHLPLLGTIVPAPMAITLVVASLSAWPRALPVALSGGLFMANALLWRLRHNTHLLAPAHQPVARYLLNLVGTCIITWACGREGLGWVAALMPALVVRFLLTRVWVWHGLIVQCAGVFAASWLAGNAPILAAGQTVVLFAAGAMTVPLADWLEQRRSDAERAAVAKSAFLANMSHEIRTPMNGVLGALDLMQESELDDDAFELLQLARASASGLLTIVDDILDLSKMDAGKMTLQPEPYSPAHLLEGIRREFIPREAETGNALELHLDPALPRTVMGDRIRLSQVIRNLISNAFKFTEGGTITLAARPDDQGRLHISVIDTGIGMSEEQCERVFLAFEQADTSTVRRFGGTGLGLAICKAITTMMEGEIQVESSPGQGTTFHVHLPLEEASQEVVAQQNSLRPRSDVGGVRLDGLRVLLVEDNRVNQKIATRMLGRLGCQLTVAADGYEALDRVAEEAFEVVLMDCQMPRMDGYETTRRIRASQEPRIAALRVIALTANVMDQDKRRCQEAGMDDFLAKPIDPDALRQALQRAVVVARLHRTRPTEGACHPGPDTPVAN